MTVDYFSSHIVVAIGFYYTAFVLPSQIIERFLPIRSRDAQRPPPPEGPHFFFFLHLFSHGVRKIGGVQRPGVEGPHIFFCTVAGIGQRGGGGYLTLFFSKEIFRIFVRELGS